MTREALRKERGYNQAVSLFSTIIKYYPELHDANLSQIIARLSPARHSVDFRCVRWFGQDYCFSPSQAIIVSQLWAAWLHGTPKMGAAALLEACDMISDRISEIFKNSDAWGTMVCTDNRGVYWLQPATT